MKVYQFKEYSLKFSLLYYYSLVIGSILRHFGYERPSYRDWTDMKWYNRALFDYWMDTQSPIVIVIQDDAPPVASPSIIGEKEDYIAIDEEEDDNMGPSAAKIRKDYY